MASFLCLEISNLGAGFDNFPLILCNFMFAFVLKIFIVLSIYFFQMDGDISEITGGSTAIAYVIHIFPKFFCFGFEFLDSSYYFSFCKTKIVF